MKKFMIMGLVMLLALSGTVYAFSKYDNDDKDDNWHDHMNEDKLAWLLEEKGLTLEEYKAMLDEKGFKHMKHGKRDCGMFEGKSLEALAELKGISVEEMKQHLLDEKSEWHKHHGLFEGKSLEALAEKKGISVEEMKQYFMDQKKDWKKR